MTQHLTPTITPNLLHRRRFSRNDQVPQGPVFQRCAKGLNFVSKWLGKQFIGWSYDWGVVNSGQLAVADVVFACGRTGPATHFVRAEFAVVPAQGLAPVPGPDNDPFLLIRQVNGGTLDSDEFHYGRTDITGVGVIVVGEIYQGHVDLAVTPDTEYEWTLRVAGFCIPVYWNLVEKGRGNYVDDADVGIVGPDAFVNEKDIYQQSIGDLLDASSDIHDQAGAHLIAENGSFGIPSPFGPTTTSAFYVADAQTAEFILPIRHHALENHPDIPMVFCGRGFTSSGVDNGVRIIDADTLAVLAEITGFTTTDGWLRVGFNCPATTRATLMEIRSDGAATFRRQAYSLYEGVTP